MPEATSKVVLRVDPATARAYRDASVEAKARARSAFASALADARAEARKEAAREFMAFMDETAREAEARGLTPEILEEILSEDPPGGFVPPGRAGDGTA